MARGKAEWIQREDAVGAAATTKQEVNKTMKVLNVTIEFEIRGGGRRGGAGLCSGVSGADDS